MNWLNIKILFCLLVLFFETAFLHAKNGAFQNNLRFDLLQRARRSANTTNDCQSSDMIHYEKYDELTRILKCYHKKYPDITKMGSIGKSVQGRELWYMQITDKPGEIEEGEPMFKYVGNMHGDEVISRQILIYLIQYLCDSYSTDRRVKKIVDSTNIFILPSMNPDGFELAKEGSCGYMYTGRGLPSGRENANNKDLNRNFPDQFTNWDKFKLKSAEPETRNMMRWIYKNPFVLSANLHGGSVVASYPFDDNKQMKDKVYSKSPDDAFFRHLALSYAKHNPIMKTGKPNCPHSNGESFKNGITNGAKWYNVPGGMQDFNYLISNCLEITVELSCCKYPHAKELKKEWGNNKESLLTYIEQVHRGIKGKVVDENGKPVAKALVNIKGIDHPIKSIKNGDYWRLLLPGSYAVNVSAHGYETEVRQVNVGERLATKLDFMLRKSVLTTTVVTTSERSTRSITTSATTPLASTTAEEKTVAQTEEPTAAPTTVSQTTSTSTTKPSTSPSPTKKPSNPSGFKYHDYDSMTKYFFQHQEKFPDLVKIHNLGTVKGRNLRCLEITNDVGKPDPTKANIALIAGLHGYDTIGREILMMFLHSLTKGHTEKKARVKKLLESTSIHIVPMVLSNEMDLAVEGDCTGEKFPEDAQDVHNKFNINKKGDDPDEVNIVKDWMNSKPLLFSAVVEGGDMVVTYPPNTEVFGDQRIKDHKTIDDELLRSLSVEYSVHNKKIYSGKGCNGSGRNRGISSGIDWKNEKNTLGDYLYRTKNSLLVNIHLSCCRNPQPSEVNGIWNDNKESLMRFAERAFSRIYGKVVNSNGADVIDAVIKFSGTKAVANVSAITGHYQKYLLPRQYVVTADHHSLDMVSHDVMITGKTPVRQDFTLYEKPQYKHHKYDDLVKHLNDLTQQCPNITRLSSMGKSREGKDLWVLEFSGNPGKPQAGKPEFAYIAGIHGNELVGRELILLLARHLCLGYGKEEHITQLVNHTRIHLIPLMNPDGAENAVEGSCSSTVGQNNAAGVDLATDFPVDKDDHSKPTQPETKALFKWLQNKTSLVYATLHSGSLVVGYPYSERWSVDSDFSPTADDDIFRAISQSYSKDHPTMSNGEPFCPGKEVHRKFKDGVVNMATWKGHSMPMLDYNYVTNKGLGFAIFTGCCKAPGSEQLDRIWKNHKKAMLKFMKWTHRGVKGFVYDRTSKKALEGATIQIKGRDFQTTTSNFGDFWRILTPGSYKITALAEGYQPKNFEIKVDSDAESPTEIVFSLDKSGIVRVSGIIFLALIASCVLVFLLMLFLLSRVCHWQKRGRKYGKNGFIPLSDVDEDEKPGRTKKSGNGKIGGNAVFLEESELSDDEEEVVFSDHEFGIMKS